MSENFNIQSLHGSYFAAEICFKGVSGRISVNKHGRAYLCHNEDELNISKRHVKSFGYKYVWPIGDMSDIEPVVQNLKILPSPIEYHALFKEILEKRGPTWSEDGSYSVIPNEVLAKIHSFMEGIKVFGPKNLDNNQNQS